MEPENKISAAAAEPQEPEEFDDHHRKVGVARFFEILGRDLWPFYKSSILCVLGFAPGYAALLLSTMADSLPLCLLSGAVGGMIAAPFLCGLYDTILRSLRDEPCYWWHTYRMAWKQNWKDSLLPGALTGLLLGMWVFLLYTLPDMENVPTAVWVCVVLTVLIILAVSTYAFAQIVLVSVPLPRLIKNSALFCIGFLPRTLIAVGVQAIYWGVTLLWMPYTLVLLFVTGFWFPATVSLLAIYPGLDKAFHLENTLNQRRDEEIAAVMQEHENQ